MGSLDTQIHGKFNLFVIDAGVDDADAWQRPYLTTPLFRKFVDRSFPLIDIRPEISAPGYNPADLLKSHGFGVLNHKSALFDPSNAHLSIDDEPLLHETYYPEIRDLLTKITGAKHIFITHSFVRKSRPRGITRPNPPNPPNTARRAGSNSQADANFQGTVNHHDNATNIPKHIPTGAGVGPARLPHLDNTHLSARQCIRFYRRDIEQQARESGVIGAEDGICADLPFPATSAEANAVIAEQYNRDGLGPRYASYSVWRPLRTVQRDPLCIVPRRTDTGELVEYSYDLRVPGNAELGGDFLREVALLGVQAEEVGVEREVDAGELKWYYVSKQTREEVLVLKFFDSAALGRGGEEAQAPWHGSPDIGDVCGEEARESIEVRVLAFW
ncbi:hypothetical protein VE00_07941 [Pseudogymnoascus sp. WSF 3629]|nr:hypothetical protein VE00_07941 [Pseudogymnoascus sp. WSF 3629]